MSSKKEIVVCSDAPKPIGPYSVAIKVGNLVFTAGQTGLDPVTNDLVSGGVEAETRQVLTNLKHVVEAAGSSMDMVVKTTVFLRDMNDFQKMNSVYAEFFKDGFPARTTVQASLPRNGAVEIEVIAALP
jgi:2-iminobutanoate/2-iminopropanoate deaminase